MKQNFEFTGVVSWIGETKHVGANGTPTMDFVLAETEGDYPSSLLCTLFGKNYDKLAGLIEDGAVLKARFNPKTNFWTPPAGGAERAFGSNDVWAIDSAEAAPAKPAAPAAKTPTPAAKPAPAKPAPKAPAPEQVEDIDDLPF